MRRKITRIPPVRTSLIIGALSAMLVLGFFLIIALVEIVNFALRDAQTLWINPLPIMETAMIAFGYFIATYLVALFACIMHNILARYGWGITVEVEDD